MLHVYCPRASAGARELVTALGANRLRNFDGAGFWQKGRKRRAAITPGDTIICWGQGLPELDGVKIVNGKNVGNKLTVAKALAAAGVNTISAIDRATFFASVKVEDRGKYFPRKYDHVGGNDLLHPPARADFYVKKENLVKEYRIHTFDGKSIRAGVKVPRVPNPHPVVRSYDGGWRIDYTNFESSEAMRKLAHKAVKAIGLTFGAVDIGERADGSLIVLEINRAPGLEGGSIEAYNRKIRKMLDGPAGGKVEKAQGER